MLTLDLPRLGREGRLSVEADVAPDDPLWQESGLHFSGPLAVRLDAHEAGSGEIIVRGRVRGTLVDDCRRCLEPVKRDIDESLTLVYAPPDELAEQGADVRQLANDEVEIDLGEAIREELVLTIDRYALCRPDCRGLCPVCGKNLNETTCECSTDEPDPRWDVLRSLQNE
jgi:uncharacterized protein